ncbi:MAG: MerR family transcriptional regulator [Phycisphaerae bacterium]|nr:MerR family transcriptional regulator [Phycisphaerae bacterium]
MQMMRDVKFKVPAKLFRIGEIVQHTPFTRQTIHNYTTMGLIQESDWTQGGHRLYDETVFERLWQIQELRKTKTLSEIRELLGCDVESMNLA